MMTNYVAGFLFSKDGGDKLLVQKKKPLWQAGKWNAVGGKLRLHEFPESAMIRKFYEETSLRVEKWELFCVLAHAENNVSFYRAFHDCIFDSQSWNDVGEELAVFLNEYIPHPIMQNLTWLIPLALDGNVKTPTKVVDTSQPWLETGE